ncbi:MAG TPA: M1 family aminopeptidase [Acidobacteriota bacterium]|jgi:hypothetical protein
MPFAAPLRFDPAHQPEIGFAPPEGKPSPANSDPLYLELRSARLSGDFSHVENLVLQRDIATFTFKNGTFYFLAPITERVTGAVFIGQGEFRIAPALPFEQKQLGILAGSPSLLDEFNKLVLRFTDFTFRDIKKDFPVKTGTPNAEAQDALESQRKLLRKGKTFSEPNVAAELLPYNLDARILMGLTWGRAGGFLHAYFDGKKFGDMIFILDPLGAPFVRPEEIVLANVTNNALGIWVASHLQSHYASGIPSHEQPAAIDVQHYDIDATVGGKSLEANAKVKFKSLANGPRVLPFDLFPKLRVRKVTDETGRELSFIQEKKDEDADFFVLLPEGLVKDQERTLAFEYGGNEAVSDSGGGNYTLDARTNWYPNTYFADRATYELTLRAPKDLTMVATGQPAGESQDGKNLVTRWKSDLPLAVAGFNYGRFKKSSFQDPKNNYTIESYANKELPAYLKEIQRAAEGTATTLGSLNTVSLMDKARAEAQVSIDLYARQFGPLPYGRIAMTQQPYFAFGQAWPMLVYMPLISYLDSTYLNQLGLRTGATFLKVVGAHEVAHQWWGHLIGWKTYRDQWMSEGFADFSASIFTQTVYGNDQFLKFWKEEREKIMQENLKGKTPAAVGSLNMGYRLDTPKTGAVTSSVMYPKGAFVLHMLRMLMWDPKTGHAQFTAMMKDFVSSFQNQNVSTEDFQKVVEKHILPVMDVNQNGTMDWFFNQWVRDTPIPDYKLAYKLEPGEQGKTKLVASLTQSKVNENFVMPVPIYVDVDGKIVRLGTALARGNTTVGPLEVLLPSKPQRVMLCYFEDVLCTSQNR